ncbi:lysylphosphatidylglycerol synthase transmembrane domain-containing protein [Aquifex sp.]
MRYLLSLAVALLFFFFLFSQLPLGEVIQSFKKISLTSFLLAFLLYSLSQVSRSLRWKLILGISFKDAFFLNAANVFFNNVLPARTGELSWFYYANKLGVKLRYSLWSFFLGRAYDLLALISLLPFSYLTVKLSFIYGVLLLILTYLTVFFIPYLSFLIPEYGKLKELKDFLKREFSPALSLKLFTLSLTTVFLKALSLYTLLFELHSLDFFSFAFAFVGGELSTILPIHGFMGYGTYELSFFAPLKLLGYELKEGLKVGFIAHNFLLLSSAVWGLLALIYLHKPSRRAP